MEPPTSRNTNGATSPPLNEPTAWLSAVWHALETVTDPEIPTINVVEMGIIADVRMDDERVTVDMTPTFSGCPALDLIRREIAAAVGEAVGDREVIVNTVYDPPWTTDRLTESARTKLKAFGVAPPGKRCGAANPVTDLETVPCPYCDSPNTKLESIFGPTLCRSIHYCKACLQPFEHFKPV